MLYYCFPHLWKYCTAEGVLKKDAILDSKVLAEPAVGELAMTQYVCNDILWLNS